MADFNSLVEEVYTLTGARHLVNETIMAVKSATLQIHRRDTFAKDLTEVTLQFPTLDYLQSIDYRTLFPRYRSLAYLRKFDANAVPADTGAGPFFEIISPAQVLDSYKITRTDVAYVAGDLIQLRSKDKIQYVIFGLYQSPEVATPSTYKSFIADEAPYAIVYTAASIIFGVLGDSNRQNSTAGLAALEINLVVNANITAKGD